MKRILITGGAGNLGSRLARKLLAEGHLVRVMSRHEPPKSQPPGLEWARADLVSGAGLAEALTGVHTVIHAASDPVLKACNVDVDGTRRLLEQSRQAGVAHLVYISIVGIERIQSYRYYHCKLEAESIVAASGLPWSILRATQFYDLMDTFLKYLLRYPVALLPGDLQFQPIDVGEVAEGLSLVVDNAPGGRLPDLGGPQVLRLGELAHAWLQIRGMRRLVLPFYLPGKTSAAFRRGYATCPQSSAGRLTWAEWLKNKYPPDPENYRPA